MLGTQPRIIERLAVQHAVMGDLDIADIFFELGGQLWVRGSFPNRQEVTTNDHHIDYASGKNDGTHRSDLEKTEGRQPASNQDALSQDVGGGADQGHFPAQQ
jgi:hypothetical protein